MFPSICVLLYVSFYMCPSICVSFYVFFYMFPSICVSFYMCFLLYVFPSICVSFYMCFLLYVFFYMFSSICFLLYVSFYMFLLYVSFYIFYVFPSICSFYLFHLFLLPSPISPWISLSISYLPSFLLTINNNNRGRGGTSSRIPRYSKSIGCKRCCRFRSECLH
jgi:hypothetical protein